MQDSPQRWGLTSFLSHLPPMLLSSGLTWLFQVPVITCAFQLVGQKIIFPFGSDISPLLKSTGRRIFHVHGKPGGGGHTEGQGNVIKVQNIHDELQGPPPLIHIPVFILLWFSPHSSLSVLACRYGYAAAAAKSLQSCPTLCNSIDGSQPGSPVPGILQARTLEWVAISFSNAWK